MRSPRRSRAVFALVACAAFSVLPTASGRADAGMPCMPVSVATRSATFTYSVVVEAGSVDCALARRVLRDAADWPAGESRRTARWGCRVGDDTVRWAITCRHYGAIVRAYGPVEEHDPWVIAGARLRTAVMAPAFTGGLVLHHVRVRPPCDSRRSLVAEYRRGSSAKLTIFEGTRLCGDIGNAPMLAVWRIHGQRATLSEYCGGPAGCSRLWGDYALEWRERGLRIVVFTHGVTQAGLLAIARSMAVVPH